MKKYMALILSVILMLSSFVPAFADSELSSKTVSVSVAALNNGGMVYRGDHNWSYTERELARGTVITLEAREMGGVFLYWRDETNTDKTRILSTDMTYTFTVIDSVKISAVFLSDAHLTGQGYVAFLDTNGRIYREQGVLDGEEADNPDVSFIDNSGYTFTGWDSDAWKNVEDGEIYLIKTEYEKKDTVYEVKVTGGIKEPYLTEYEYDDEVVITLDKGEIPKGKKFAGWSVNGEVISQDECFAIKVGCDMEIEAIYDDEEAEKKPLAAIIDADAASSANGASFLTARYVPEGFELIESGILFASGSYEGDMVFDNYSVTKAKSFSKEKNGMFRYNKVMAEGMSVRAVPYVIYEYDDTLYIAYGSEKTIEK